MSKSGSKQTWWIVWAVWPMISAQNLESKAAIGPNLFTWDACTNVTFQTVPRSLLHFGRCGQYHREARRFSPGRLECNRFRGWVWGGEKQGWRRWKPGWEPSSEASAALWHPGGLRLGRETLTKHVLHRLKSTKRPCCLGGSVFTLGLPRGSVVTNLPASAGDTDLIPGSGRSRGGRNGYSLQDSCLENSMDGAWQAPVHGIARESDIT